MRAICHCKTPGRIPAPAAHEACITDAPIYESAQTINVSPELDALVDAALEIAAEHGWRRTSVREAAERACIGRVTALRLAPVKLVLLKRLAERTD